MTESSDVRAARARYPLINDLYDKMIEIFKANTPKDDHIHPTPLAALPMACEDLIGESSEPCMAIIKEAIRLAEEGDGDLAESGHTWGMAVIDGQPEHEHIETYHQVVHALFYSAMAEMLYQRNPELVDEGERKTKEWEERQSIPSHNLGEH